MERCAGRARQGAIAELISIASRRVQSFRFSQTGSGAYPPSPAYGEPPSFYLDPPPRPRLPLGPIWANIFGWYHFRRDEPRPAWVPSLRRQIFLIIAPQVWVGILQLAAQLLQAAKAERCELLMTTKIELTPIMVRFSESELEAIEDWRREQTKIPPLAHAVRELVRRGLQEEPRAS